MGLDHVELDELRIRPSGNRPTDDLPMKRGPVHAYHNINPYKSKMAAHTLHIKLYLITRRC